jgi:hypothetical protein
MSRYDGGFDDAQFDQPKAQKESAASRPGDPMWGMPSGSLVKDSGSKIETTVLPPDLINKSWEYNDRIDSYQEVPMEICSGTAKQTVDIIGFGDPVAQPGPYVPLILGKEDFGEPEMSSPSTFGIELMQSINRYSKENTSNTPDWILSEYMQDALEAYNKAVAKRERWYGRKVF